MSMYMKFIAPMIIFAVLISKGKFLQTTEGFIVMMIVIFAVCFAIVLIGKIFDRIRSFVKKSLKF